MYRGAMAGFGRVASQAHVPAWQTIPTCRIVAVADPEPARLDQARSLLPGVRCYDRLDTLLDHEELDFLDVCTPPALHDHVILQACARGMHVLCEKPLTLSAQAFQQITKAAAAAEVLVFPVHNWKYAPLFQTLKRLLEADEIGRPVGVELDTLRTKPAGASGWRLDPALAGGGILMDHGWHAFYLLLFLLGESPQAVTAQIERRRWMQAVVEDTATCTVRFPHAEGRVHLTWAAQQRYNSGVIHGARGEIRIEDSRLLIRKNGHAPYDLHLPEALSAGSYHPAWLAALLPDFYAALRSPRQYETVLQEAEACLRLTLLAYRSASLGVRTLPYEPAWPPAVA